MSAVLKKAVKLNHSLTGILTYLILQIEYNIGLDDDLS